MLQNSQSDHHVHFCFIILISRFVLLPLYYFPQESESRAGMMVHCLLLLFVVTFL